ncbi:chorismate-binding protein [Lutimonas saemankumensis]|uniref:chorismate-binding protein n=1 Tax=Lutimonas saemankumensis TaxID=483016 RepID=UPI001CD2125C|nr:chorismate-binding protein [Lutimonas saemankumensis]MCA0933830.1 chorismate-binding protein [Lutimonas saemankumensis]
MDIKGLMKKILEAQENQLPFTVFRYPESNQVFAYVQHSDDLFFTKDFEASGFVMAPFDLCDNTVIFPQGKSDQYNASFDNLDLLVDPNDTSTDVSSLHPDTDITENEKMVHLSLVRKAITKIRTGECQKIVVSRKEELEVVEFDIPKLLKRLILTYPSAMVYVWFHPKVGLWAGATPETFLLTEGNNFKTMSLAGTQKYEGNIDVRWGPKEIEEQRIVTRHIENVLHDLSVESGETYTVRAGNLLHLCNEIKGEFGNDLHLRVLIDRLHPTPAVCGLPRTEAMDFIRSEENYKRDFYTGFLGEINKKKDVSNGMDTNATEVSKLFVNLRCMQISEKNNVTATLYIGGGITDQSDPDLEWLETVQKGLVMKSVL